MKATQISSFAFATVAALAGTSLARGIAKRGVLAINHAEGANVINVAGEFSFGALSCYKVDDPTRRKKSPIRVVCEIPDGEKEILFATPVTFKSTLRSRGSNARSRTLAAARVQTWNSSAKSQTVSN
ncbi:hypothetical protein PG990_013761 [Apiospora arundinis]